MCSEAGCALSQLLAGGGRGPLEKAVMRLSHFVEARRWLADVKGEEHGTQDDKEAREDARVAAGRVGTSWGGRSVRLATRLSPIDSLPKVRQPPPAPDRSLATSPRPYQYPAAVLDSLSTADSLDTHFSCQPLSAPPPLSAEHLAPISASCSTTTYPLAIEYLPLLFYRRIPGLPTTLLYQISTFVDLFKKSAVTIKSPRNAGLETASVGPDRRYTYAQASSFKTRRRQEPIARSIPTTSSEHNSRRHLLPTPTPPQHYLPAQEGSDGIVQLNGQERNEHGDHCGSSVVVVVPTVWQSSHVYYSISASLSTPRRIFPCCSTESPPKSRAHILHMPAARRSASNGRWRSTSSSFHPHSSLKACVCNPPRQHSESSKQL